MPPPPPQSPSLLGRLTLLICPTELARCLAVYSYYRLSSLQQAGGLSLPIFHMRKLRLMEVKTLARDHTANKWQSRNPNPVRLAVEPTRCPHTTPILSGLSSLGRGAERCCRSPKVTQQVRGSREAVAQASPTPKVHPGSAWSLRTSGHRPRKSGNLLFSIPQSLIPSPTPSFVGLEMGKQRVVLPFLPIHPVVGGRP